MREIYPSSPEKGLLGPCRVAPGGIVQGIAQKEPKVSARDSRRRSVQVSPIDPRDVTDYGRDYENLEAFWLHCILAAGKNADWASAKVLDLAQHAEERHGLIEGLNRRRNLRAILERHRVGQYRRIEGAIRGSRGLDLRQAPIAALESVYGVGPKTARYFVLHSREGASCAVLDVHILRFMRENGHPSAPDSTPSGRYYVELERKALGLFRRVYPGMTPAQADLRVWTLMSGRQVPAHLAVA